MLLQGQRFVVTGIASKLSIAWAIAEALHREGASLILTYPNDKIKKRVDMAAEKFEADLVLECDVASDESIAACFEQVTAHWVMESMVWYMRLALHRWISLMAILLRRRPVKAVKLPMISQAIVLWH